VSAQEHDYRVKGGALASAWKIAAGVGVAGVGGALAMGASDPKRFAYSYLFAFATFLALAVGATFFVLFQHVTSAGWSVTTRRTAEFFMSALPVFALLFVPVALHVDDLYGEWANHGDPAAAHAPATLERGDHAAPAAHGEPTAPSPHGESASARRVGHAVEGGLLSQEQIEHLAHSEVISAKSAYLNKGFFYIRALIYFAAWAFIALSLFRNSTSQDASKDKEWTRRSQRMAPWAIPVLALTTTFASFDWYMSLLPSWYSTIFGVWHFSASMVALFAVLTLTTLWLSKKGLLGDAVTLEHFHDLGKLLFGFNCFWAYISFSQFFLIWYAGIPEEADFYHLRWGGGPWVNVSVAIAVLHFIVPFVLLMSRNVKRNLSGLTAGAVLLVVMHVVEMYWLVLPNYARAMGVASREPGSLRLSPLDLLAFVGVGGVYLAAVLYRMANHSLVAVGDPRFERSRHFENA
jgi:hypothetical protein